MRSAYLLLIILGGGCVEGFRGSNVQIDLSEGTPVQAAPGAIPRAGELPDNIHFKLYAITETEEVDQLFELQRFELHRIVNLASPCFIDVGQYHPFPGLHASQYRRKMEEKTGITDVANPPSGASETDQIDTATAIQRQSNIEKLAGDGGIRVVTDVSTGAYPAVDATCTGAGIPPAMCIDAESNARRLRLCQEVWAADPTIFEGTDRVLTSPLSGTTFGFVVGMNPINLAPVGGAQFFVDESLDAIDEYAIYYQTDGMEGPGTLLMSGRPVSVNRGVSHVKMSSPTSPNVSAHMAIFADLGDDDVHF